MIEEFKKTKASKLWFSMVVVFVVLLNVSFVAPNYVFADAGAKPSEADARKVYEATINEAISKGLVRISKVVKTDGQSREAFGVKGYHMDVEIELEVLQNVAVCSSSMEGTIQIIPEAEYSQNMDLFCITKRYKAGRQLAVIGSIEFEKTEKRWKARAGNFAPKKVENWDAALYKAVVEDNPGTVKTLIKKGADVDVKNASGNTALVSAVTLKISNEIIKMLVQSGADINARDSVGWTVLMLAIVNGNTEIAKMLLAKGADVNVKNDSGVTALILAANKRNTEIVKMLLAKGAKGADLNTKDNDGQMDLLSAVEKGHNEIVKMLLAKGADVNKKNEYGNTALFSAVNKGNTEIVKLLLDKGADVNEKYKYGSTPLIWAVRNENPDIVKMLLEKGADVRIKDTTSKTVFDYINDFNIQDPKILEMLKYPASKSDKGVDVNAKNKDDNAALISAVAAENTELVKTLLDKGADVNAKDNNGNVVLIYAVEKKNAEVTKMLLDKGADVNAKNINGVPVLSWSAANGNTEIVKVLLDKGADVNAKNPAGNTGLMFAVEKKNTEIVKMLLEKGADVNIKDNKGHPVFDYTKNPEILEMLNNLPAQKMAKGADVNAEDTASQEEKKARSDGKGTVVDNKTKLMWQQGEGGNMDWDSAVAYCKNLSLAGYNDWRLPNIEELKSITYFEQSPAIDEPPFPNAERGKAYWSSYARDSSNAGYVIVGPGLTSRYLKTSPYCVRCVRSGQ